jgi:hypothetical protein
MLKKLLFAALLLISCAAQATVFSLPWGPKPQFVDANGAPMSSGTLLTFAAASTTPQVTYTDSTGGTANPTTITLNTRGESPNEVWLTSGQLYKFVLKDSSGVTIWTVDNVQGVNDITISNAPSEWISGPTPTYVSGTSFTLAGDQTPTFTIGRRVKTTNSGGTVYSTITNSVFGALTTITIVNDSSNLDAGLSAVSYGMLSANNPSVPLGDQYVNNTCQGRLTLTTATPVTTSDVTAATTLYFTPYLGNTCAIYDGTKWTRFKFSELSIAVPNTTSTMYDVWLINNSGVLALEVLAWTNDTTRATALTTQDGVYVKTGATTRRYLGSFRTTGVAGQTEDSLAKRFVWNYYNRVIRRMKVVEATGTWTYTTATYRQANAAAANQLDFIVGVAEDLVTARVMAAASNGGAGVNVAVGIALDATNTSDAVTFGPGYTGSAGTVSGHQAVYNSIVAAGRHFLAWTEISQASGTTTWSGLLSGFLQSGISGEIRG